MKESPPQNYSNCDVRFKLGLLHEQRFNLVKAVDCFFEAAKQGHSGAQFKLGWLFGQGDGVPKDFTESMSWYFKAAEQGHSVAQFNIGIYYYNGTGVRRDYTQAIKWFHKAAENSYVTAQFLLGKMYHGGKGCIKDTVQAEYWYSKAAKQGHLEAIRRAKIFAHIKADDTQKNRPKAKLVTQEVVVDCTCKGENENCYRCGGSGVHTINRIVDTNNFNIEKRKVIKNITKSHFGSDTDKLISKQQRSDDASSGLHNFREFGSNQFGSYPSHDAHFDFED